MSSLLHKTLKKSEYRSNAKYPDNWHHSDDWAPVPPQFEALVLECQPYLDVTYDEHGAIADILPRPRPAPAPAPPTEQEITAQALAELSLAQVQQHEETQQALAELTIMLAGGMTNEI